MELVLPIIIFAFALYILGSARRGPGFSSFAAGGRGDWVADFRRGSRRVGGVDIEDLKRAYDRFALEREGRRLDRAPYEGPRVAYLHGTARAVLSLHLVMREDGREEQFTQIAYAVPPGWRHRMEIGPLAPDELAESPLAGLVRVLSGDLEFDQRTRVLSSDGNIARTILDAPTRRALGDLRELLANGHVHLSAAASRIFVRKRGVVLDAPDLSLLARLCDSIYDRILLAWERENGIEILEESSAPAEEHPKCQVCSHPIAPESRVRCRRCRTPHHTDCWEFNGGCATFACGEKHALKGVA